MKKLSESIWSDMQDRSAGETVRKEDYVNALNRNEFYDYLKNKYNKIDHLIYEDPSEIHMTLGWSFFPRRDYKIDIHWVEKNKIKNLYLNFGPCELNTLCNKKFKTGTDNDDISNEEILDIIDFCLDYISSHKEIESPMNESIWSDMQDRSAGETVRKEDDINLLDINELCEYLKTIYKTDSDKDINVIEIEGNLYLVICLYEDENGYYRYIYYDGDYINTPLDVLETLNCLFEFERKFSIIHSTNDFDVACIDIYPKDKERVPVTNKFFIEVLDFILDRINAPLEQKIEKISDIKESIWSDMQDRSSGEIVRKEDDIDHLDYVEFFAYLTEHYKPKSKKDNEKIGGRTPIMDTNIIEIFIPIESIDDRIKTLMIVISKKDNSIVSIATSQTLFDKYVNLERTLSNNYTLNPSKNSPRVYIKSNKKLTNNTIVNLINTFIAAVDNPILERVS